MAWRQGHIMLCPYGRRVDVQRGEVPSQGVGGVCNLDLMNQAPLRLFVSPKNGESSVQQGCTLDSRLRGNDRRGAAAATVRISVVL